MESNSSCPSVFQREITGGPASPSPSTASSRSSGGRAAAGKGTYDGTATGLRLGRQQESCGKGLSGKRARASQQNMHRACCQVEGCSVDLRTAKDYHRRHRICENHSKCPKVIVAGLERRFCQQCSRFHDLSEFDEKKRSCRRRLSDHNTRRRRVQPESVHLGSSSTLYDERQQKKFLLNGLPVTLSDPSWENANTSAFGQAIAGPSISMSGGFDGPPSIHKSIFQLHMDLHKLSPTQTSTPPRLLDQCLQIPTNSSPMGLLNAHSLLSSSSNWSWGLNDSETTTTPIDDGIVVGNYLHHPVMRRSNSDPQGSSVFQEGADPVEQGMGVTMVHCDDHEGINGSQQEYYELFNPSTGFCANGRTHL